MQLRAIGLYSHDGQLRALRFQRGALNVISGLSRTGKTELLKIIDFCAGRQTPSLAEGPITRKVSWFAAVFESNDGRRVLTVRPQPKGRSTTVAMVALGVHVDLPPDASSIEPNATTETVRGALDDLLGLGGYDVEEYGRTRERLRASTSHAIQFCLQSQTELMSPSHLFHRGDDSNVAEDFAELFPYFLGAVDEDTVAARRQAARLRRQLQAAERQLAAVQSQMEADRSRDRSLVQQAVQASLVEPDASAEDPRDLLIGLVQGPATAIQDDQPEPQALEDLRAELSHARLEVRELRERKAALHQLYSDRGAHQAVVQTQLGRLGIVEHISGESHEDHRNCPACGAQLEQPDDSLEALAEDAAHLEAQMSSLSGVTRDLAPAERELDAALAVAEQAAGEARQRLEAAVAADSAAMRLADADQGRARLLGVIEEYLRGSTNTGAAAHAEITERISRISEEFAAVEPGTDRASITEELDARLGAMSVEMTNWARELGLERADEGNVHIDRRTLNVAVGTSRGRIGLSQTGSGANHVGYHLVAHLALHQHFVRERRPVPRFLFIDQPSLPFFPRSIQDRDAAIDDVDWQAVRGMMLLADRVVRQLEGNLQMIITDHASFAGEGWFDQALVEDWHTGEKLVPDAWESR